MDADKEKKLIDLLNDQAKGPVQNSVDSALDDKSLNIYRSIDALDDLMRKEAPEATSPAFTDNLMQQVMSEKVHTSGKKVLRMLLLTVGIILAVTIVIFSLWSAPVEVPAMLTSTLERFYKSMAIFGDPKFKQLFLIAEGIILLVILEKIISGYRFFHKSTSEGT